MADPVSLGVMAAISIGTTALSSYVSAKGAQETGQAQSQAYTYQAGVAEINKKIADENAAYAIKAGAAKGQISDMQTRAVVANTKAKQGASNLDVNSGTNVDVRASEAEIGALNTMTIRSNADREAYGYKVEGVQHEATSTLDTMAAKTSKKAGDINALSSIIGGASSVSSKWAQFGKAGVGSPTSLGYG